MISLTKKAVDKVKEVMTPEHAYLRAYVVGNGCSGITYKLALDETCTQNDVLIEKDGIQIVIDKRSNLYLEKAVIDSTDKGFFFVNEEFKATCGCHQAGS